MHHVDVTMAFVICSEINDRRRCGQRPGASRMKRFSTKTLSMAAALGMAAALAALATSALAQSAAPTPWELKPDMGYGYDKEGKTFAYKMGTNNAGLLLKGAKKVPKGTLFFIGQNGQLYMRTGPFLEGDSKFMFGTN
jgi:hypothetical protein